MCWQSGTRAERAGVRLCAHREDRRVVRCRASVCVYTASLLKCFASRLDEILWAEQDKPLRAYDELVRDLNT